MTKRSCELEIWVFQVFFFTVFPVFSSRSKCRVLDARNRISLTLPYIARKRNLDENINFSWRTFISKFEITFYLIFLFFQKNRENSVFCCCFFFWWKTQNFENPRIWEITKKDCKKIKIQVFTKKLFATQNLETRIVEPVNLRNVISCTFGW